MFELKNKKVLSSFSLVMINVIAVDSLRNLPISAEYGFSLVFFYLVAGLTFFVPTALISAELATSFPETGGIYVWVREAFGQRWGLLIAWLQWIYNIVWFPTILAFIAATMAYLIDPNLAQDKFYLLGVILVVFWAVTILNLYGLRVSSWVSMVGALLGTLAPMLLITSLGIIWLWHGKPINIDFSSAAFFPHVSTLNNLTFMGAVYFGLMGIEMSAVHAGDVKNPRRDYPRALLISVLIIILSLVFSSLAIAIVVPVNDISLVAGVIDAFAKFFNEYHMAWMVPVSAMLIVIGGVCGVSTWIIGPTKALMVAAQDGCLPVSFAKLNKNGAPGIILIVQGIFFTILCSVFLFMPSVNSSYWLLSDLTAQLALLVYIVLFASAIRLRYKKQADNADAYRIPFGNFGIWFVGLLGMVSCFGVMVLGFIPPAQIDVGNVVVFEVLLGSGMLLICIPPFVLSHPVVTKRFKS